MKHALRFIVGVVAIVAAVFLCKMIGSMIYGWGLGNTLSDFVFNFIADKIDILGVANGRTNVTLAEIDTFNAMGKASSGDPNWTVWHYGLQQAGVPDMFWGYIDGILDANLARYGATDTFALARPIAEVGGMLICIGIGFLALLIAINLVGALIIWIIAKALRLEQRKGIFSRLLGLVFGIATAASILWSVSLAINIIVLMDNPLADHIKSVLEWDVAGNFHFAKWYCQFELFHYNDILSYFTKA